MIAVRARLLAGLAALTAAFAGLSPMAHAEPSFQTLDNNTDPTFNQLLGINNSGLIAGYYGIGSTTHPNVGYTLAPPYGQGNYSLENFPGSVQTQVTGLNNTGVTVGFWADAAGDNFGWVKTGGTFTTVDDPNTPTTGITQDQILGVNDHNQAVGFYLDATGASHGFVYDITTQQFTEITVPNASNVTATGINNSGMVSGFYTDSTTGNIVAFVENVNGTGLTTYEAPGSTITMFLGLNNVGQEVGTYVDAGGTQHGLLLGNGMQTLTTIDVPGGMLGSTTINGLNDLGQLVGFYTDANGNVDGVLINTVPEPASMALLGIGLMTVLGYARLRRSRHAGRDRGRGARS